MPAHDEALNDLSSMPPVSVTMQPRNLPAEAELPDDGLDEPLLGLEGLAHPAASTAMTPNAATALMVPLTVILPPPGPLAAAQAHPPSDPAPGTPRVPAVWAEPAGVARRLDPFTSSRKHQRSQRTVPLPNRDALITFTADFRSIPQHTVAPLGLIHE